MRARAAVPAPDPIDAAVQWARQQPLVAAVVGQNVTGWLRRPLTLQEWPVIRVRLLESPSGLELDQWTDAPADLEWHCWGAQGEEGVPDGAPEAYAAAAALRAALVNLRAGDQLKPGVALHYAGAVTGPREQHDPVTGRARYIVESRLSLRAVD